MFNHQGRLFTFGCSFTNYYWITWADILGKQFSQYENWGLAGAGNHYIFNSLVEANKRNQFTKDDTIIIMWSTIAREDRYINKEWLATGQVYSNEIYSNNYIKQFVDDRGFLIRDLAFISAADDLLRLSGANYHFLSLAPLNLISNIDLLSESDVITLYQDTIDKIEPSMYEVIWDSNWDNRSADGVTINSFNNNKVHINNLVENMTKKLYNIMKGDNWPTYESYIKQDYYVSTEIINELNEFKKLIEFKKIPATIRTNLTNYTNIFKNVKTRDHHPTPLEHLEYLIKVFPELIIDPAIISWVTEYNKILLTDASQIIIEWQPNLNGPKIRL